MAETTASPKKKATSKATAKPKASPAKPVVAAQKTTAAKPTAKKTKTNPANLQQHYKMVEVAAYYIAEKDGFASNPVDYWIAAEIQIKNTK